MTHFRNPVTGFASGVKGAINVGVCADSSMLVRVVDDSNQKRQVICQAVRVMEGRADLVSVVLPQLQTPPDSLFFHWR